MSDPLHLPDLTIEGFRGIDHLTIPRLGRVTLIAGKNGVGKTTVLEAVRVFAARGRFAVLVDLLKRRQEVTDREGNNGHAQSTSLFFGRNISKDSSILIGPRSEPLDIHIVSLSDKRATLLNLADPIHGLAVNFRGRKQVLWDVSEKDILEFHRFQRIPKDDEPEPEIRCETVGPEILADRDMARIWDSVALTDDEDKAVRALELILGNDVLGVAMIGNGESNRVERKTVVRLKEEKRPVPLKSLGDGAVRLFGIALAIASSRSGLLLIDEAENGIHHTVQRDLWRMILSTAHANDVQVLATTHSWDCVRGFAYAAAESERADGILIRLDRDERGVRAVEYSEEDLKIAADQGIEVR